MIAIQKDDFDINNVIGSAKSRNIGALVIFLGIVRDDDIELMELEAYEEVAIRELEEIAASAKQLFPIESVDIIHRIGPLHVGDNILLIVVGAGHRRAAFEGCEYIIERIKKTIPIWKKEERQDGVHWVKGETWE